MGQRIRLGLSGLGSSFPCEASLPVPSWVFKKISLVTCFQELLISHDLTDFGGGGIVRFRRHFTLAVSPGYSRLQIWRDYIEFFSHHYFFCSLLRLTTIIVTIVLLVVVSGSQPHACFVLSTLPAFPHFHSCKALNPGITSSVLQKWLLTYRLWEAAVVYCRVRLSLLGAVCSKTWECCMTLGQGSRDRKKCLPGLLDLGRLVALEL